jgi:hypothetical protein
MRDVFSDMRIQLAAASTESATVSAVFGTAEENRGVGGWERYILVDVPCMRRYVRSRPQNVTGERCCAMLTLDVGIITGFSMESSIADAVAQCTRVRRARVE